MESVRVKVLVHKKVPAKPSAHNAAAMTPQLKEYVPGLRMNNMPKKPRHTINIQLRVNLSFKKIGASIKTQSGVVNSNANNCDSGIKVKAKNQRVCPEK